MENQNILPVPPWDMESAAARLQFLEDDFNSLDAEQITQNFTNNAEVRFGTQFLKGSEEIKNYFSRELAGKKSYYLKLDLWGALKGRMAVRSELSWVDSNGNQIKTYGVQVFQFSAEGLIEMNYVSFNDHVVSH